MLFRSSNIQKLKTELDLAISNLQKTIEKDIDEVAFPISHCRTLLELFLGLQDYIAETEPVDNGCDLNDNNLLADLLNNPESLSPFAVRSIPEDLKDEISLTDTDKFEIDVLNLIDKAKGKRISINNLLIALKISTGVMYSRSNLNNRLYRMVKKDILFSVPGRKGLYTTNRNIQYESNKEKSKEVDLYNEEII